MPVRVLLFALEGGEAMKRRYRRAMEWLYLACVVVSGTALVVITLIIPLGVFMRYAMNSPLSWPEPAAVIMMVMFSFLGGAAVYRANVHIAVQALLDAVSAGKRRALLMAHRPVHGRDGAVHARLGRPVVHHHALPDDGRVPVAVGGVSSTLPIPIAGLLTLLFLIERVWVGEPPKTSVMYSDQAAELE